MQIQKYCRFLTSIITVSLFLLIFSMPALCKETQYDKVIKLVDKRLPDLKGMDVYEPLFENTEMILWYAAKLEPQRPEAYDRIIKLDENAFYKSENKMYYQADYEFIFSMYDKLIRVAKKCKHKDLETYIKNRENFRKKVDKYKAEVAAIKKKVDEKYRKKPFVFEVK